MAWPLGKPKSQETKQKMQGPKPTLLNTYNGRTKGIVPKGMARTKDGKINPMYSLYYLMLKNCTDPKYPKYKYYGAKNIKVCQRWLLTDGIGFANFLNDVGERPSPKHNFKRIDGLKDFSPENCVWKLPS